MNNVEPEGETEDPVMFQRSDLLVRLTTAVAVVFLSCTVARAAELGGTSPIVRTAVNSTDLSWQPTIGFESAVLVVSGPGNFVLRKEFSAGDSLALGVIDKRGEALADGQYAWEIRFSPVLEPEVKEALRAARETGDSSGIESLKKRGKLPNEPLVTSGYFRVVSGTIVTQKTESVMRRGGERTAPAASEATVDTDSGVPTKDQVILDDQVVTGSLCVGFDCANGESFGFDTIRIKENNLRIKAQDTSNSASFPSNDWQITFNDSSNGGANKFSIDDIDGGRTPFTIEASAPSHSLYVDDGGRIGFGTSTPVVNLHVKEGNTPTLRLEQDGSSGFTPQTWDVAGNETNFFIRDATNGSTLPFRIFPGAPSNALTIEASTGDVGVGTTSPDSEVDIEGSGPGFRLTNTGSTSSTWDFRVDSDSGRFTVTDDATNVRNPFKIGLNAANNLLKIGTNATNRIDINGSLFINGVDNSTPDYVFEHGFQLESIEEHAEFMWQNKHLPALAPAEVGEDGKAVIDVASRSQGVLEELEKAHIYIQQLNERIKTLEAQLENLAAPTD